MLCCANNWMCNMDFKYVFTLLKYSTIILINFFSDGSKRFYMPLCLLAIKTFSLLRFKQYN